MRGNGGAKHGAVAMVTATVTVGTSSLTRPGAARQRQRLSSSPDSDCVGNVLSDRIYMEPQGAKPPIQVRILLFSHPSEGTVSLGNQCVAFQTIRMRRSSSVVAPVFAQRCDSHWGSNPEYWSSLGRGTLICTLATCVSSLVIVLCVVCQLQRDRPRTTPFQMQRR